MARGDRRYLIIWYLILVAWMTLMAAVLTHAQEYPLAPPGMCMDGVGRLAAFYPNATFCYDPTPAPGHVWIIVNGTPIDSYLGELPRTREWLYPPFQVGSFAALEDLIHGRTAKQCPVTGMWEQYRRI